MFHRIGSRIQWDLSSAAHGLRKEILKKSKQLFVWVGETLVAWLQKPVWWFMFQIQHYYELADENLYRYNPELKHIRREKNKKKLSFLAQLLNDKGQ